MQMTMRSHADQGKAHLLKRKEYGITRKADVDMDKGSDLHAVRGHERVPVGELSCSSAVACKGMERESD